MEDDKKIELTEEEKSFLMFKDWISGKTFDVLSETHGVSRSTVYNYSKKYKWSQAREEVRKKQFQKSISKIRSIAVHIQDILEEDLQQLSDSVFKYKRPLTSDERAHLRAVYDRILKEIRLEDGTPTDITRNTTISTEIVLPAGVRHFGIIPPDPRVKVIEHEQKKVEESIDIDSIEED